MARIVEDQLNLWGASQGIEAQRSDLWIVDFRETVAGIKAATSLAIRSGTEMPDSANLVDPNLLLPSFSLATFFARTVVLPELRIRADAIRRDSRPYNMPSWDEPLDAIRMSFLLDCFRDGRETNPYQSDIYNLLDFWRAMVRAGRGPMGSEYAVRLNDSYRIDYAYDVAVRLLRPGVPQVTAVGVPLAPEGRSAFQIDQANADSKAGGTTGLRFPSAQVPPSTWTVVQNDLQEALVLTLTKCWLSSFKVSDLSQEQAKTVQIDATFYAENIEQEPIQAE